MTIAEVYAEYCELGESVSIRQAFYEGFSAALTAWSESDGDNRDLPRLMAELLDYKAEREPG